MIAFLVGLLVLALMGVFSIAAMLLWPLLLVLGLLLRLAVAMVLVLMMIWLTGKVTLALIAYLTKTKTNQ